MKLQLQCDDCGLVGDGSAIPASLDGCDLCPSCAAKRELADLKRRAAARRGWLEQTHLADLAVMEAEIARLEAAQN